MSYMQPNQNHPQNQQMSQQRGCYQRSAVDVPIMSSKEQTQMWQQNTYMVDSGIHSGNSSQVPSIIGKEEEMDLFDLDTHRFTQSHDDLQQPPSVFPPEPLKEDAVYMDCQEDTDCAAARAIPQLTKLLGDVDLVVVGKAAVMVHQLSKKAAFRHAIIHSDAIMSAMVRVVATSNDLETLKGVVGAIHKLSHHRDGMCSIIKSGGVPALVRLLSSEVESVLYLSITTLHNLLLYQEESKQAVRMAGGVQKLVPLLRRNNVKFLTIVTDCLQILAYGNQDSKMMILASDGSSELVRIMRNYDYEKLLWTTSRVLKVLSVCSSNKPAIIESGGLMALSKHLRNPSLRLVQNCLWTLRNLSDAATKIPGLDDLLMSLVEVLHSKDVQVVTCAAGILSNLTCNNECNKKVVYEIGGVEALIQTIMVAGEREDITEPLVCTLRHLTSKSGFSDRSRRTLVECNGVQVIVKLLNSPCSWPMVKALIGLVRNVALLPDNVPVLRECGAVHHLAQLVGKTAQDLQKKPAMNKGVKMEDIVEGTVSTLHILSRDSFTRAIIRQQMIVPILVQLLYNESENVQRAAVSVLSELSVDKEGAVMIEQEGAAAILTDLLQSRNDAIVSFATTTLMQLQEDRSNKRSPNSLNSLFQEDGMWDPNFEMVAELQEILSSDQNYGSVYNQDGSGMHNNQTLPQQGFDQVSVEMSGLDSGNSSSYSALLEAMEVTMADTENDLNFSTMNQLPSTPQDTQQSPDWSTVSF